jgi:type IV fimbrial biogenesis protein FimT
LATPTLRFPGIDGKYRDTKAMAGTRGRRRRDDAAAGWTLLEMLVCLLVIGIVAGWGVPTFGTVSRNADQTSRVNLFIQAVYLARSEAIKRNGVVSLCPTADGTLCQPAADWRSGWLVFVNEDRDSPAMRDPGEEVLHVYEAWDGGHILSNRSTLSFRAFGQVGVTATVAFCDDRGAAAAKAVIISQTGRPRISTRSASGGPLPCL